MGEITIRADEQLEEAGAVGGFCNQLQRAAVERSTPGIWAGTHCEHGGSGVVVCAVGCGSDQGCRQDAMPEAGGGRHGGSWGLGRTHVDIGEEYLHVVAADGDDG